MRPGTRHRLHEDLARLPVLLRRTLTARFGREPFTTIRLHSDRLGLPLQWRQPRRIFVNSMNDLFHQRVPDDFIARRRHCADRTPPFAASLDAHAATINA